MSVMRIAALSGSLRAASVNTALLGEIAARAPGWFAIALIPLGGLPLFNPDLEDELPDAVAAFRAEIVAADALIIASPEYAHGIVGVVKNALDWLVACEGFAGKPVLVINAAPRAHPAITALHEILTTMAARIIDDVPLSTAITQTRLEGFSHAA